MKAEERVLWVSLVYNWETKKKLISLLDDSEQLVEQLGPGDHLYRARLALPRRLDSGATSATTESIGEEEETRTPRAPDETMEAYVARQAFFTIHRLLPPHSISVAAPCSAANSPNEDTVKFTVCGKKYVLSVREVPEAEADPLTSTAPKEGMT